MGNNFYCNLKERVNGCIFLQALVLSVRTPKNERERKKRAIHGTCFPVSVCVPNFTLPYEPLPRVLPKRYEPTVSIVDNKLNRINYKY